MMQSTGCRMQDAGCRVHAGPCTQHVQSMNKPFTQHRQRTQETYRGQTMRRAPHSMHRACTNHSESIMCKGHKETYTRPCAEHHAAQSMPKPFTQHAPPPFLKASKMQDPGWRMQDVRCSAQRRMQDAESMMQSTGCRMHDAGCRVHVGPCTQHVQSMHKPFTQHIFNKTTKSKF